MRYGMPVKSTRTNRTVLCAAFAAALLAVFVFGCGRMQQAWHRDQTQDPHMATLDGRAMPVMVGSVTSGVDQSADLKEAICRYLRDQAAVEISRHGAFVLVGVNASKDLLSGVAVASSQATEDVVVPAAAFDVEVVRLEEKPEAAVQDGSLSSTQKHAVVEIRVTLRSLTGGKTLTSVQQGKSSKGAWGVITSVNRETMKGGQEEWRLDGSMVGVAFADAVRGGIEDLEKQTNFRAKALDAGIAKRLLRPRTERGK